jgi:DNA repair protein RadC
VLSTFAFHQNQFVMESKIMYTEAFPSGPMRHYFFDYKQGPMGRLFVQITCSEKLRDGSYHRNRVVFFERDLHLVVQALASLCHHAGHLKLDLPSEAVGSRRERGIPSWDPAMKPRERMAAHGAVALSDPELLAMLIWSGTTKETAVGLAARILEKSGGLQGLMEADFRSLSKFSGVGLAKSSAILSAVEIARRLNGRDLKDPSGVLPA